MTLNTRQIFHDEILGSGQFGVVYAAKHRRKPLQVAIKQVDKKRFQNKDNRLIHEVQILAVRILKSEVSRFYQPHSGIASSGHCESVQYVRKPKPDFRCDGETSRRHAGYDYVF